MKELSKAEEFYIRHTVTKLDKLPAGQYEAADQLLLDLLKVLDLHQVAEAYEKHRAKVWDSEHT